MSVIADTYRKAKRRHQGRLVLFESGVIASFLYGDAKIVSRALGESVGTSPAYGCEAVSFGVQRERDVVSRLEGLGFRTIGYRREQTPPRKWVEFSFDPPADVSKIAFAHTVAFADAIEELRQGAMETDWIWFAFPKLGGDGGRALRNLRESRIVLSREPIAQNIREAAVALLSMENPSADAIFGAAGSKHLKASATLFALTAKARSDRELFGSVLARLFGGELDGETVEAVKRELKSPRDDTPSDLAVDAGSGRIAVLSKG